MLIIVTLLVLRNREATCFVYVEEMTFKFSECWKRFVKKVGASDVGVKTLVRSSVEWMITTASDGTFDEVCVRVRNSSVIAVARKNANAVEIGSGDLLVLLS